MASRSISAILWTLVSVNFLTLIVGGLTTWLGYTIPVRLKQAGLLPELVIVAGSASLVVACMGLCALNYSSANALNIYACSCALFVLVLVLGIPESWYKSSQFVRGTLLLDIIYFGLLFLLLLLFVFAITLAQYMRRRRLDGQLLGLGDTASEQRSHLLDLAPQAARRNRHRHPHQWQQQQPVEERPQSRATRSGCTCVMITPPPEHDNGNQNMLATGPGSVIDRWFARLKPSRRGHAAIEGPDHYQAGQARALAQAAHPRPSSALAPPPGQREPWLWAGASCSCPCERPLNPLQQHHGATLPPLISRGIYRQPSQWSQDQQQQLERADRAALCRSAGELCNSDELLADWAPIKHHHGDHRDGPLSQDDTSIKYADGWRQTNAKNTHNHRQQQQQHQQQHKRRADNANYSLRGPAAGGLECSCPTSTMSPYTLPMINTSSSVYSISGSGYRNTSNTNNNSSSTSTATRLRNPRTPTPKARSSSSVVAMTAGAAAAAILGGASTDLAATTGPDRDNCGPTLYGCFEASSNGPDQSMALIEGNCIVDDYCDYGQ